MRGRARTGRSRADDDSGPGREDPGSRRSRAAASSSPRAPSQIPFPAFAIQRTKGLRWTRWGGRKAEARGKAITPIRRKPIRVHITLSRPKRACGSRVFSKVTFRFQFNWYKKDPLYLVAC